jgi:hypothetical protein
MYPWQGGDNDHPAAKTSQCHPILGWLLATTSPLHGHRVHAPLTPQRDL